uniref:Chemosensory protein n=1 Tax=Phenacoccus solenopsis TaxID=483260 RepID=A0A0C5K0Z7_9HEMI|nr:chemosensory protein [Phenacoccus solenopsis]
MKLLVVLFTIAFAIILSFSLCKGEANAANNNDIDSLLADKNFVRRQIHCVLGKARCDKFGNNLKASIPKVISQNCQSCTPEEAANANKIVSFVKQNYPDVWKKVAQRYSGQ